MDINNIKIFYEVAILNSTIKAANKLEYTQSNISKRIAKLEKALNTSLFFRNNKGMFLTTDGEQFLSYAEEILSIAAEIEDKFSIHKRKIRIGATQSISRNYLQKYLLNVNISIYTKSIKELIQLLKDCIVDFIVVNKKQIDPELKQIQTMKEKAYWIKAKKSVVNFSHNSVVVSRDIDCPYRITTISYLKERNLQLPIIEVDTMDILVALVESEKAIAVLPEIIISSNSILEVVESSECMNVNIYVYALQNSKEQFILSLD